MLINADISAWFAYLENNHYQYQLGMIDEEQMNTIRAMIADELKDNYTRRIWIRSIRKGAWRASFAAEVDGIIAERGPARPRGSSDKLNILTKDRCFASGECRADSELH